MFRGRRGKVVKKVVRWVVLHKGLGIVMIMHLSLITWFLGDDV